MPQPPFSGDDVRAAFPDFTIDLPELGCGSFKVAYRARGSEGDLVVKILHEAVDGESDDFDGTDLPERFVRELKGMSVAVSPHLVRLIREPALVTIGNAKYLWYAEPFYSGGTLTRRIGDGQAGPELARQVLFALLEAIATMWQNGQIVHRDIKPDNIVFDSSDRPVLLDLGIAYFPELTTLTDAMGTSPRTPRYAAPEQFEMRRVATIDFRTDLYLAGMTVFEALTGKHPFWEPSIDTGEYFRRMEDFDGSRLDSMGCPAEFKPIMTRLLSPRPSGRFRTVELARRQAEDLV